MDGKHPIYRSIFVTFLVAIGLLIIAIVIPVAAQGTLKFEQPWMVWGEKNWPTKPVRGGYFRVAAATYVGLMNPNHWPVNDWNVIGDLYEEIFYVDGALKPSVAWLAEDWKFEDAQTVWMKMRRGIQFHDGTTLTAESVKYQMEWIKDKKNGCWSKGWLTPIKSIEIVDQYTLRWHFNKPWASFIGSLMAYVPGYQMSMKSLKGEGYVAEAKKAVRKAKTARKKADKAVAKARKAASKGGKQAIKTASKAKKAEKTAQAAEKNALKLAEKAELYKSLDTHPVGTGAFMLEKASPGNYRRRRSLSLP